MVIKTVYKTTDGKSFDTMKDAMSHQNDLDRVAVGLYNKYLDVKGISDTDPVLVDDSIWVIKPVSCPTRLTYVKGTFREAVKYAVTLKDFWEWGIPGSVTHVNYIELSKNKSSDEAYPDCRAWQMKNGEPYPKSSCYECGSVLNPNFKCKHGLE